MPNYTFRDKETHEEQTVQMFMSEREKFLEDNPHLEQIFNKFPGYVDPVTVGVVRHSDGFNDVLKKVQKAHPLGYVQSR